MHMTKFLLKRNVQTEMEESMTLQVSHNHLHAHGSGESEGNRLCEVTVMWPYMSTGQLINLQLRQM